MLSARQKDWALSLPAFTIVTILAVIPAMMLFVSAFSSPDIEGFTLANFEKLWNSKLAMQAFWRTIRVSISVTLITIILGYPLAIGFLRANARLQPVLLTLLVFPLMVSVVVRAYGWIVVLSPSGILNQFLMGIGIISEPLEILHTEWAVILGESQLLLPYMVLSLVASLQKADTNLEEASMSLGANPVTTFFRIVIPVSVPGLLTGTLLVFALALTAFATPLLLGGGRTPLLTTLIYTFAFTTFDWSAAAAVGLVLIVLALSFVALQRWVGKKVLKSYE
ncbi:ABC transporter permease [Sulfitobacter sp.]|jgi:putative spermidine/putrescine transport system permease protein|uniref:ABC transporter permease n=1 Tax=Sulfitobacter sp. TaxID=1903071 RepID=UPI003001F609